MANPDDGGGGAGGRRRRFTVDALFADHRPQATGVVDLPTAKEILLDRIEPDPDQPRRTFDLEKLDELAASIRIEGILQPIVVRYDAPRDTYVVVHGERRWRAARLAGLDRLPAIVREVPVERRLIQQLMENIVRDDLNAVDRAGALRALKIQLNDAPWEEVAEAVGIRRSRLFQLLGTEKLPDPVQDDIRSGRLSEKQSRALQGLAPAAQEALRAVIVADGMPAAEAMRLGRELRAIGPSADVDAAIGVIDRLRDPGSVAATTPVRTERATAPALGDDRCWSEISGRGSEVVGGGFDTTVSLLREIRAAAIGSPASSEAVRRAADAANAPAVTSDQIAAGVHALALALARVPAATVRPDHPAYVALVELRDTLDSLLPDSRL